MGLSSSDMKMKAAVVPRRGAPVSLRPLATGIVAQEQPGRSTAPPTAAKSGPKPLPPTARFDHFQGRNACSAAPAAAPTRKYGSTIHVRCANSRDIAANPAAIVRKTVSDKNGSFRVRTD